MRKNFKIIFLIFVEKMLDIHSTNNVSPGAQHTKIQATKCQYYVILHIMCVQKFGFIVRQTQQKIDYKSTKEKVPVSFVFKVSQKLSFRMENFQDSNVFLTVGDKSTFIIAFNIKALFIFCLCKGLTLNIISNIKTDHSLAVTA